MRADEPGVAAHQLDDPDAVARRCGLGMGGFEGVRRDVHRGLEAEGLVDEGDVVVDRLGDADHAERDSLPRGDVGDGAGALEGAVAADRDQQVHAELFEAPDHVGRALCAPTEPEDAPAGVVDVVHDARRERDGRQAALGDQPLVAEAEAEDVAHAVHMVQLEDERSNHAVDSGAEPSAGHDPCPGPGRVEEDLAPGTRPLERQGLRGGVAALDREEDA